MLAGLMVPERPVGNMYFAAWSHNVINCAVQLSNDLKMGEYRELLPLPISRCLFLLGTQNPRTQLIRILNLVKIPPRVMFLTQVYGTVLGGFINYAVMISIVNGNRELLVSGNGNSSWSGAQIQAFNTNASSWALSKYLYKAGATYEMVPIGLAIGAGLVMLHRIITYVSTIVLFIRFLKLTLG